MQTYKDLRRDKRQRGIKMKGIKYLIIFLYILVIGLIIHEHIHWVIFKIFHCENITLTTITEHLTMGIGYKAVCTDRNVSIANGINEVVGYTLIPFLAFISTLLIKISEKMDKNRKV